MDDRDLQFFAGAEVEPKTPDLLMLVASASAPILSPSRPICVARLSAIHNGQLGLLTLATANRGLRINLAKETR